MQKQPNYVMQIYSNWNSTASETKDHKQNETYTELKLSCV